MPRISRSQKLHLTITTAVSAILALAACGSPGTPTPKAPAAPSNVTASAGPGYMIISWAHDGQDVEGFEVFRSALADTTYAAQQAGSIGVVAADHRSFKDDSVAPGVAYSYAVRALGDGADSEPTEPMGGSTTLDPGIDLVVGTSNHPLYEQPRTAVGVYLYLTDDQVQAATGPLVLTGPDGWNGGEPFELGAVTDLAQLDDFIWYSTSIGVVAGEYQLAVPTTGETFTASASVDASDVLELPTDVAVALSAGMATSASWSGPSGASSHWVGIYAGDDYATATRVDDLATKGESVSLSDVTLPPGTYFVAVYSTPFDMTEEIPSKAGQFNIAVNVSPMFTISPPE